MSKKDFPSLTKTCAACGKRKPLSSFLVMTNDKGTLYGNICGDCQKAGVDKQEDSTRSTTGRTIDNKARIKSEADKKEKLEKERDATVEEGKTEDSDQIKHSEKKENKERGERKVRESFLNRSSFLSTKNADKDASVLAKEMETAEQREQNALDNTKQDDSNKEERQTKNIDTSVASQGTQTGFQEKHRRLLELTAWMGDSPMIRNIKRAMGEQDTKNAPAPEEPRGPSSRGRR